MENRRSFLKKIAVGSLATLPAAYLLKLSGLGSATIAEALEAKEVVKLDNPTASALGYQHDVSKVDLTKFPKRATAEGKTQFCSNCQFAQGEAKAVDGQEGQWLGCQIIPGKLVAEKGWCNSWIKKAG